MWNSLLIGHMVSVGALCTAGWSCALFASDSHKSVGPFARIVSREPRLFARIVGREILLFASPSLTVRKPLHLVVTVRVDTTSCGRASGADHALLEPFDHALTAGGPDLGTDRVPRTCLVYGLPGSVVPAEAAARVD